MRELICGVGGQDGAYIARCLLVDSSLYRVYPRPHLTAVFEEFQ
jgi:GDP-D-mannose dehydratase